MKFGSNAKRIHFDLPVVGLVTLSPAFSSCCRCSRLDFSLVFHFWLQIWGCALFTCFTCFSASASFPAEESLTPYSNSNLCTMQGTWCSDTKMTTFTFNGSTFHKGHGTTVSEYPSSSLILAGHQRGAFPCASRRASRCHT